MDTAVIVLTSCTAALALGALIAAFLTLRSGHEAVRESRALVAATREASNEARSYREAVRLQLVAQRVAELSVAATSYPLVLRDHSVALALGNLRVALAPLAAVDLRECVALAAFDTSAAGAAGGGPHPAPDADFCRRAQAEVAARLLEQLP